MDTSYSIEQAYQNHSKEIFTNVILVHIFDDDVKYEDKDIFEKTERFIQIYFEELGFIWTDLNRTMIHELILSSENAKWIDDSFEKNLKHYLTNNVPWVVDRKLSIMVNSLIDESFKNEKPLSFEYARKLLVKYYYAAFKDTKEKEKLFGNLMAIHFSVNNMVSLIKQSDANLDKLINNAYISFRLAISMNDTAEEVNPKIFARRFVQLKNLNTNQHMIPNLQQQLQNSIYRSLFNDLLEQLIESLSPPNISDEKQKTFSNTLGEDKKQIKSEETLESNKLKSYTKQNEVETANTKKRDLLVPEEIRHSSTDSLDIFLSKIGGKGQFEKNPIEELLLSSQLLLKNVEKGYSEYGYFRTNSNCDDLWDTVIDELLY